MQIILREDVENLGRSGEVVQVRDGYARNFLVPRGLAVVATPKQVRRLQHEQRQIVARAARLRKDAEAVAQRLEGLSVTISAAVGEEQKLYGSVTAANLEEALRAQDLAVSKKQITMPDGEPIRALGMYTVDVKLAPQVTAKLKVWVVAKE
jgi:large subunit ribosomal protein L9